MYLNWLPAILWWSVMHVVKEPCHTSALGGEKWVNELLHGNPRRCRSQLRMQPDTFLQLLNMLEKKSALKPSRYVSAKEKLATFLYIVGNAASNRQAQERFQRSGWTITQSVNEGCHQFWYNVFLIMQIGFDSSASIVS